MRNEAVSEVFSRDRAAGEDLSFAAFVLAHAECPGETLEVRIGEGLLLEWCPMCTALETFGVPGERALGQPT